MAYRQFMVSPHYPNLKFHAEKEGFKIGESKINILKITEQENRAPRLLYGTLYVLL